jgi:TPR repeat protein
VLTAFKQSLENQPNPKVNAHPTQGKEEDQSGIDLLLKRYPTSTQKGPRIRTLLTHACAQDQGTSCLILGAYWEAGLEGPQNIKRAGDLYQKACTLAKKNSISPQDTSSLLHPSWGCVAWAYQSEGAHLLLEKQNKPTPHTLLPLNQVHTQYKKACTLGLGIGCDRLGGLYQLGIGIKKSMKTAFRFYKKACEQQWMLGCTHAGFILSMSASKRNQTQAQAYFTQACERQEGLGCTLQGLRYLEGKATLDQQPNPKKAHIYFDQACQAGELLGCVNLGILHALGTSGDKNKSKARRLFQFACKHTLSLGCQGLERLQPKNKFNLIP